MKKETAESEVNNEVQENETQQPNRLCDVCRCKEVCRYRLEYEMVQMAIDNLVISTAPALVKLSDIPWIKPVILNCKHYIGPSRW